VEEEMIHQARNARASQRKKYPFRSSESDRWRSRDHTYKVMTVKIWGQVRVNVKTV
jgi:hypothetical protein